MAGNQCERDRLALAIVAVLFASMVVSLGDVLVKTISEDIDIWQVFILRSLIIIPLLVTYFVFFNSQLAMWPKSIFWILVRSSLLVGMWVFYFLSLAELTLADATALFFTSPIFIAILTIISGERANKWCWLAIFLGFIGIVLIVQPGTTEINRYIFFALLAALFYALSTIVTRNKCRKDHPVVLSLFLSLMFLYVGIIASAYLYFVSDNIHTGFANHPWAEVNTSLMTIIVLLALVQICGSIGIVIAYQNAPPATIGVFDFSQVVFAVIWGVVFFREVPDLWSQFGIFLVVFAGAISVNPSFIKEARSHFLKIVKSIARFSVSQHNKIQFFGYEVANLVLLADAYIRHENVGGRSVYEVSAAIFFLCGSLCIWRFDDRNRPGMLFYGGVLLTFGGISLVADGYVLTGLSVSLASLETMRGGLFEIANYIEYGLTNDKPIRKGARLTVRYGAVLFGWYVKLVSWFGRRFPRLGGFMDNRPFLAGTLIKAPFRLEFIIRKILIGDYVGAGVGVSWMVLGDCGLALNDQKLKSALSDFSSKPGRQRKYGLPCVGGIDAA